MAFPGTLNLSNGTLETINALRAGEGLPPLQSVDFAFDQAGLIAQSNESDIIKEGTQEALGEDGSGGNGIKLFADAGNDIVYNAKGDPALRSIRRPIFDSMLKDGVEVDGNQYTLNQHAYNSLFKSQRKDIMPVDILDALRSKPLPGNPGSLKYINPVTGTKVFINPMTKEIVGVWPVGFGN